MGPAYCDADGRSTAAASVWLKLEPLYSPSCALRHWCDAVFDEQVPVKFNINTSICISINVSIGH